MRPRNEQPVVTLILKELEEGPATAYDLCEVVGIHIRNMRPYMKLLLERGRVKISRPEPRTKTPGPRPPIYILERNKKNWKPL